MHVLYHSETLAVECVMYDCHEVTARHNRTLPNHVEHPEKIPHREIEIVMLDGRPTVRRRAPMPIEAPALMTVGIEALISGVPEGVRIAVDGGDRGVMDASGRIEFTAEVAGFYKFAFSGSGWIGREIEIEAVAG